MECRQVSRYRRLTTDGDPSTRNRPLLLSNGDYEAMWVDRRCAVSVGLRHATKYDRNGNLGILALSENL